MPKFAAGIVLYNPKQEQLEKNITHIIDQVDRLYLVDNGSDHIEEVRRKYEGDPRVLILSMGENKGIAAALNRMMAEGEAEGFDWVLTLDQDSICESDLLQKYAPYLDFDKVAMITPYVHYVGQADRPADGWPPQPLPRFQSGGSWAVLMSACSLIWWIMTIARWQEKRALKYCGPIGLF